MKSHSRTALWSPQGGSQSHLQENQMYLVHTLTQQNKQSHKRWQWGLTLRKERAQTGYKFCASEGYEFSSYSSKSILGWSWPVAIIILANWVCVYRVAQREELSTGPTRNSYSNDPAMHLAVDQRCSSTHNTRSLKQAQHRQASVMIHWGTKHNYPCKTEKQNIFTSLHPLRLPPQLSSLNALSLSHLVLFACILWWYTLALWKKAIIQG